MIVAALKTEQNRVNEIEKEGIPAQRHRRVHAVQLPDGAAHVVRCKDGDGEEETYKAACLLAGAVGIDFFELEDG